MHVLRRPVLFRSRFRRISFTRREIPKLWRLWVTFRTVLRSFSLFMILCFATAHSSPVQNALIVPKPCIVLYRFLTSFDVFLGTHPSLNVRSLTKLNLTTCALFEDVQLR